MEIFTPIQTTKGQKNVKLKEASSREVRLNNSVPGIVYGKGIESIPVQVEVNDFLKSYHQYGKNLTFNVTIGKEKLFAALRADLRFLKARLGENGLL